MLSTYSYYLYYFLFVQEPRILGGSIDLPRLQHGIFGCGNRHLGGVLALDLWTGMHDRMDREHYTEEFRASQGKEVQLTIRAGGLSTYSVIRLTLGRLS